MNLRTLRRQTIRRMGPVKEVIARRYGRAIAAIFAEAYTAERQSLRVFQDGLKDFLVGEIYKVFLRPIVRDVVDSLKVHPKEPA
jgi:hypothetical protein